jgi:hypothetical protein
MLEHRDHVVPVMSPHGRAAEQVFAFRELRDALRDRRQTVRSVVDHDSDKQLVEIDTLGGSA